MKGNTWFGSLALAQCKSRHAHFGRSFRVDRFSDSLKSNAAGVDVLARSMLMFLNGQ
jgi:hypothetical protein